MSVFSEKKKYWVLGACAGVLVLAGGLCAILLGGPDAQLSRSLSERIKGTPVPAATEANLVIGTPEVDLVAEQHRKEIEAIVIRSGMLPGTIVYGVDVSGMTREEAKRAVEEQLTREPPTVNLSFTDGTNVYPATAEGVQKIEPGTTPYPEEEEDDDAIDPELNAIDPDATPLVQIEEDDPVDTPAEKPLGIQLRFDVDKAVGLAFSLLRDVNIPYDEFMAQVKEISAGKEVTSGPAYDVDSVDRFVSYMAGLMDVPAVNATISLENNVITYLDEIPGRGIDQAALTETILSTDPLSGATITIPMQDLEPTLTRQMLDGKYTLRGHYQTSFSGSKPERKYNIRFGADKINGTILKPGDIFSANEVLGKRTRANGWKLAGAYESGEHVQQYGGGVCQLSSTLYNAVILADLEIVERRNHSMPVSYIPLGRDATINSVGNIIDFKFKNSSSSDIIVVAYTEGNLLNMDIYGIPISQETDEYDEIKITSRKVKTTRITTVEVKDNTKPATYRKETYPGKEGYTYRANKDYYKNGEKVKTVELPISVYKMFPRKVTVGTKPVQTATPKPSSGE